MEAYYTLKYLMDSDILKPLAPEIKDLAKVRENAIQILNNHSIYIYVILRDGDFCDEEPPIFGLVDVDKNGDYIIPLDFFPANEAACHLFRFHSKGSQYFPEVIEDDLPFGSFFLYAVDVTPGMQETSGELIPIPIEKARVKKLDINNAINKSNKTKSSIQNKREDVLIANDYSGYQNKKTRIMVWRELHAINPVLFPKIINEDDIKKGEKYISKSMVNKFFTNQNPKIISFKED